MVNSVVKGDFRAFEFALSYRGHLYGVAYIKVFLDAFLVFFCRLIPMNSKYMIKKELAEHHRVPGNFDQKIDSGRFGHF